MNALILVANALCVMFAVLCFSADSFYAGVMFLVGAVLLNTIVLLLRQK